MAKNLKVGDRVTINLKSRYYSKSATLSSNNPIHCEGVVNSVTKYDLGVAVQWDNGKHNSYDHKDLDLVNASNMVRIPVSKEDYSRMMTALSSNSSRSRVFAILSKVFKLKPMSGFAAVNSDGVIDRVYKIDGMEDYVVFRGTIVPVANLLPAVIKATRIVSISDKDLGTLKELVCREWQSWIDKNAVKPEVRSKIGDRFIDSDTGEEYILALYSVEEKLYINLISLKNGNRFAESHRVFGDLTGNRFNVKELFSKCMNPKEDK